MLRYSLFLLVIYWNCIKFDIAYLNILIPTGTCLKKYLWTYVFKKILFVQNVLEKKLFTINLRFVISFYFLNQSSCSLIVVLTSIPLLSPHTKSQSINSENKICVYSFFQRFVPKCLVNFSDWRLYCMWSCLLICYIKFHIDWGPNRAKDLFKDDFALSDLWF